MIVILSCYFLIEKSIIPCDVKLFFSFCDRESVMLTKIENLLKPKYNRNRSVSNYFGRFRLGISQTENFDFGWSKLKKPAKPNRLNLLVGLLRITSSTYFYSTSVVNYFSKYRRVLPPPCAS